MAFDKILIAPITDGMRRDVKPWMIPDRAFEELNNAYNFRGRIKKRIGSFNVGNAQTKAALTSRLRIKLAAASGTVPLGATIAAVGQMFSVGNNTLTANIAGNPAVLLTSGGGLTGTYDTTTGAYVINGSGATDVYFYPALPVMGFTNYERIEIDDEHTYAFDTAFSYRLLATGWEAITPLVAAAQWTGTDSQFFWSESYRGQNDYSYLLFTTNYTDDYVTTDNIRYYDGTNWVIYTGLNAQYASNATDLINGCRLIISFQNRLLFLNTIEYDTLGGINHTYTGRCRYSAVGSPFYAAAIGSVPEYWPWREDIDGSGSFIDAPTREAIVSCVKIKNRLIVFFERSTYEIVYTGNQVYPFRWQEINSQLGCESTFSVIPFDKVVLGIGQEGIHACTGANVERIDSKIPDEVFQIHNDDDGVFRVHGIRDYYNEMSYWTMPSKGRHEKYPSSILVYNYVNDTWAFFDDNVTAFGYHQLEEDLTWTESIGIWEDHNEQWDSGVQESLFKYVIAGNQQGFTFLMSRDWSRNAFSQQITDITHTGGALDSITSIDHNLTGGDWIHIHNCTGITELNDNIYKIKRINSTTFTIDDAPTITGTYAGSGTISLVSKIDIYTKRFNFYSDKGLGTNIEKTDFLIDKENSGEMTIDYLASASRLSLLEAGSDTGALLGTGILEARSYGGLEDTQERFWHAVYLQAQGESVQLRMYWTDAQMSNKAISLRWFEINGILFHASPTQEL